LGLVDRLASRQAVYVIDLNVFWDAVRQRARSQYAAEIVSAALHQLIYVAVASEFAKELHRTSRPAPRDPALEFALQLPFLPEPEPAVLEALVDDLGKLIFPMKTRSASLSVQDRSDLIHLATAIHHSANAFVTSENAILQSREGLYSRYGVEVLHVEEFSAALKTTQKLIPAFRTQLSSDTLHVWELVAENSRTLELFLQSNSAPAEYCEDFLAAGLLPSTRKRMAVTSDTDMVCLASWDSSAGLRPRTKVRLIADEEHPAVEAALNCIIGRVCAEASRIGPVLLRLCTPPGHAVTRKVALLHGFQPPEIGTGDETYVQKLSVGRPVTATNWARIRKTLEQCSGLLLQEALPTVGDSDVEIAFTTGTGAPRTSTLSQIERLLSPTVIIAPNRTGAVAPIRHRYAEQLLQASAQMSFAPNREATLFSERVYFSSVKNARTLSPGTALLFYESGTSGGRACITAIARVVTTEIHSKAAISAELLRHGVLDSTELGALTASDSVAVTTFDSVLALDRPVRLERLREIGCVDGSNLISAKTITHEQLVTIVEEGFLLG
jgi:predicted nucleic acid-binding protein